jgi:hypothetical protein
MQALPPEQPMTMIQLNACVMEASRMYEGVSPLMIKTVVAVEGGQIGTVRRNTDNSLDLGPMQINTVHLPDIASTLGYSARDLVLDGCKNIKSGAWLLYKHLKDTDGRYWLAMGNYHSKTPSLRLIYLKKMAQAYSKLIVAIRNGQEGTAIGRTVNWGRSPGFDSSEVPSLALLESMIDGTNPTGKELLTGTGAIPRTIARKEPPRPRVVAINNQRKTLRFIDNE